MVINLFHVCLLQTENVSASIFIHCSNQISLQQSNNTCSVWNLITIKIQLISLLLLNEDRNHYC